MADLVALTTLFEWLRVVLHRIVPGRRLGSPSSVEERFEDTLLGDSSVNLNRGWDSSRSAEVNSDDGNEPHCARTDSLGPGGWVDVSGESLMDSPSGSEEQWVDVLDDEYFSRRASSPNSDLEEWKDLGDDYLPSRATSPISQLDDWVDDFGSELEHPSHQATSSSTRGYSTTPTPPLADRNTATSHATAPGTSFSNFSSSPVGKISSAQINQTLGNQSITQMVQHFVKNSRRIVFNISLHSSLLPRSSSAWTSILSIYLSNSSTSSPTIPASVFNGPQLLMLINGTAFTCVALHPTLSGATAYQSLPEVRAAIALCVPGASEQLLSRMGGG